MRFHELVTTLFHHLKIGAISEVPSNLKTDTSVTPSVSLAEYSAVGMGNVR